ncbi:MAG: hypothetical protein HC860_26270 [Alkalinema sp. RU_4_3]|nr:hypothetical protein [Alkalinema sp. RU_4_3]
MNRTILTTIALTLTIALPAQALRPSEVPALVYKQIPTLPTENQYINKETKKVDKDNTLVSRLMRYHLYLKGRPASYRLDWKLTIADYLGVNDIMDEATYPSREKLKTNPMEGDRKAIQSLSRSDRDALVQTMTDLFNQPRR